MNYNYWIILCVSVWSGLCYCSFIYRTKQYLGKLSFKHYIIGISVTPLMMLVS